jgi:hypothetical protein
VKNEDKIDRRLLNMIGGDDRAAATARRAGGCMCDDMGGC